MAREQGYRSRAAFKLKQLDRRFGFLEGANYVLDIGAAPGGWLQVAAEAVGEDGLVIGVDLERITNLGLDNVKTVVGDVMEEGIVERVRGLLPGMVDVVLSDLSPTVSGAWDLDHFRQIELAKRAMEISEKVLKPEGWFIVKVFQGSEFEAFLRDARMVFNSVKVVKPKASRKGSAEIYLVARGLREPVRPVE